MVEDDPLLGRTLAGRYRLIARLGTGGMSSVYLARHVLIERLSAIKVLEDGLAPSEPVGEPSVYAETFLREARAVNRINHPNIVEISDYGEALLTLQPGVRRNIVYLVMEYVPGESLLSALGRSVLSPSRALNIAIQIGSALARAHQTGIIHRDIKPENILLVQRKNEDDLVKLTDFGVAKIAQRTRGNASSDHVFGTAGYIAPEYLLGETAIDGRADLYSLGVVLYAALSGMMPFDGTSEADLLTKPLVEEPIPLGQRVRGVPPQLEAVVMRCLRRRADERPNDAFAFLDELSRAALSSGIRASDPLAPQDRAEVAPQIEVATIEDDPAPPSSHAPGVPPAPRLGTVTPASLVSAWHAHWRAIEARIERSKIVLPPGTADDFHRAMLLTEGIERVAYIVAQTQRTLDETETEAREFRATMGNAIDHLARDLSKEHARVQELLSERAQLHLRRRHAKDPGVADAILWEEASIDAELRKAKAIHEDLGQQIGALQDELFRRNNLHEDQVQRTMAGLEGEAAAMATLHRELELLSMAAAMFLQGVTSVRPPAPGGPRGAR